MKMKRNYLTSEEIMDIIIVAKNRNNSFERRIITMGMVAQFLIEDLPKFETCDEIYDYLMKNEVDLYETVINIYDIDECIAEELGTAKVVQNFLNDVQNKIEDLEKKIDVQQLNSIVEQLKAIDKGE